MVTCFCRWTKPCGARGSASKIWMWLRQALEHSNMSQSQEQQPHLTCALMYPQVHTMMLASYMTARPAHTCYQVYNLCAMQIR